MKSIGLEIKKIDNLIFRKLISFQKETLNISLSPAQIIIIKYLDENSDKEIYQSDIQKHFPMRKSTLSGVLDTMEKNDLIKRIDSSKDARSKKVILTNKSLEINNKIKNNFNKFEKLISKDIDNDDLKIFYKVLNQIENNLRKEDE